MTNICQAMCFGLYVFFHFIFKIVIKEDTSVGSRYSKPHFIKEPGLQSVLPTKLLPGKGSSTHFSLKMLTLLLQPRQSESLQHCYLLSRLLGD